MFNQSVRAFTKMVRGMAPPTANLLTKYNPKTANKESFVDSELTGLVLVQGDGLCPPPGTRIYSPRKFNGTSQKKRRQRARRAA